jgi:hypothetical protein
VQIEANRIGVRDTEESRRRFAEALVEVVSEFVAVHYEIGI